MVGQHFAHDLRRLLGAHIWAGDDFADAVAGQMPGTLFDFLAPVVGQLALGITARMGFGFTMAQQPELHSFGSSSRTGWGAGGMRSEEHTSELQSQSNLVCRL